jgi:ribonuclease T2
VTSEASLPVRTGTLQVPPNSQRLLDHEWSKHGTCSGLTQAEYFQKTAAAAARLNIPDSFRNLTAPMRSNAGDIERLYLDANPGLRAEQIAVKINRFGQVYEVVVCLDKVLEFTACKNVREPSPRTPGVMLPNIFPGQRAIDEAVVR